MKDLRSAAMRSRSWTEDASAGVDAEPRGDVLLDVRGLDVTYHGHREPLRALRDVSLRIRRAEIVGVVGESGCGKSTLSAAILRLLAENGEISGGSIRFGGRDLLSLTPEQMRRVRGREIAMIFQDPMTSLNPTFTIGAQLVDAQRAHAEHPRDRSSFRRRAIEMLERVGIPDPADRIDAYPHEFSGGMRQRIMIAMALLLEPKLLIADEPTSALDVTLEAQILELLRRLRDERGTSIMFVSHDLGVVAQLCDRVLVMYAGSNVEEGDVLSTFEQPLHPYTDALIASVPSRDHRGKLLATIPGRVPALSALPQGCTFAARCPYVQDVNLEREPRLVAVDDRYVRCNIYDPSSGYVRSDRRPNG